MEAAVMETAYEPKEVDANSIVKRNVLWSMGLGLVPMPLLDIALVTGVQIKMLNELAKHYKVEFKSNLGKSAVASLIGGIGSETLATGIIGSILKSIPVVGYIGGVAAMPLMGGAATYAVGKVFIQHFASGGTFLDFKPAEVRAYFAKQFEEGKLYASKAKEEKAAPEKTEKKN